MSNIASHLRPFTKNRGFRVKYFFLLYIVIGHDIYTIIIKSIFFKAKFVKNKYRKFTLNTPWVKRTNRNFLKGINEELSPSISKFTS